MKGLRLTVVSEAIARYAKTVHLPAEVVERELAEGLLTAAQQAEYTAVPQADRDALTRADTPADPDSPGALLPWFQGETARLQMRSTAVAVTDAAKRLGLTDSAVRRVLGPTTGQEVELLGFKGDRGAWRVYTYQLPDMHGRDGEPGTAVGRRVQRSLPPNMDPVAVAAWWDSPNSALYLDGQDHTPRRWIERGLDPDQVIDSARNEDAE